MNVAYICQHSFIADYLRPDSVVLDCGANHGEFSSWLARNKHCTIHAFEPDPELFKNLPQLEKVHFHPLAISDKTGTRNLNIGMSTCSSLTVKETADTRSVTVKTISLAEFCSSHSISRIDLLKLDIEGEEIPVLLNLAQEILQNVRQITVEFHEFLNSADLPRIREIIAKLKRSGFFCIKFTHDRFYDVLFLNTKSIRLSFVDKLMLGRIKYQRGIARRMKRRFLATRPAPAAA